MKCIKCKHIVILPKDGSVNCINCDTFYKKNSIFNKQFNTFEIINIICSINNIFYINISKNTIFRLGYFKDKHISGFIIKPKLHNLILKKDEDFIELIEHHYKQYLSYINNLIFE